jgi:4-amino-4-deoxy-L-arabinose transferase-like glycosyltransferase
MRHILGFEPSSTQSLSPVSSTPRPTWSGEWLKDLRPAALLCLLCIVLYAPGLAEIPPLDRDEARFAQATRQMLETGDFIRIRFQDEARNRKPIGIYWLQAASVAAFSSPESRAIWPYRLPSALAAALAVLLTFGFGSRLLASPGAGFVAAVLLASGLGLVVEAHLAKTDAVLLAAIVAGQGALGLVYAATRTGRRAPLSAALVFWLAEAVAILLKGPPGPMVAFLTAGALSIADRDLGWIKGLRPVGGILLMGLVAAPWMIAIQGATEGRFISDALSHDLLPKLVGAQELHGAPPGYYLVLAIASFWPGSLFIVPALLWGWQRRRSADGRFLLAWLVPSWVFFELVPTKLPHYVLPLYPALALLAGGALADRFTKPLAGWARYVDGAVALLWGGFTTALAAALIALPIFFGGEPSLAAIAAAPVLLGVAFLLLSRYWRPLRIAGPVAALALAFVLPAALAVAPRLDLLWLSRSAAAMLARHPPGPGEAMLSVGYSEPSLIFLLGTATRLVTAAPGDAQLAGAAIALVNNLYDSEFQHSLIGRGFMARAIDRVEGLDYSAGGGKLILTLYRLERG